MKLPVVFEKYRAAINAELKSVLDERPSKLFDMMRYHMGWMDEHGNPLESSGGKALRPTLCLMACEGVGADYRKALPAAAALELVHNYSLIHDDIQDDDRERRHRPTVWSIWGKPQAINAGTAMRILANVALRQLKDQGITAEKQLMAHNLIDEKCISLIEGQYLDISFETRLDITIEDYLDMIAKKTAALTACALELGALIGTEDKRVIEGFSNIGADLGMAFQIRDDILGIWGNEKQTGKPSCSDIRRKKKSFPVVWALGQAKGSMKSGLIKYYGNGVSGRDETEKILRILETVGAQEQAQKIIEKYRDEALSGIVKLPLNRSSSDDLKELLNFLAEREF